MSILKINLWKIGLFKQVKFLISPPQIAQSALYHSEMGMVSLVQLPSHTGFLSADADKKAWKAEHILKLRILRDGEPVEDSPILPICDRSYMPLDPLKLIKADEKETRRSLKDIAGTRHDQVLIDIGKEREQPTDIAQTIIVGNLLIIVGCIICHLVRG